MYTNCHVFANRTRDLIEKRTAYSGLNVDSPFKIATILLQDLDDSIFYSNYVNICLDLGSLYQLIGYFFDMIRLNVLYARDPVCF